MAKDKIGTTGFFRIDWTGEGQTRVVRMFLSEGSFVHAYNNISRTMPPAFDEQTKEAWIRDAFHFTVKWTGSSNAKTFQIAGDDSVFEIEDQFTAVRTMIKGVDYSLDLSDLRELVKTNEDAKIFDKYFGIDKWLNDNKVKILGNFGYNVVTDLDKVDDRFDGAILNDGTLVQCENSGHLDMYELLYKFGYVDNSHKHKCENAIHISSGKINGSEGMFQQLAEAEIASELDIVLPDGVAKTLWTLADRLRFYAGNAHFGDNLLSYYQLLIGYGGKYNNLRFLKYLMPEIKTPKISLDKPEGAYCVRSSPKYSMAGIMDSYFGDDVVGAEDKMLAKFEQHKDVIKGNEINYFYQEQLDGPNGVCHFGQDGFSYALSASRGDIVGGKAGSMHLTKEDGDYLEGVGRAIYDRTGKMVQLEFVMTSEGIYVVQLRLIKEAKEDYLFPPLEGHVVATGRSFSIGGAKLTKETCLITDKDLPAEALIGYKGLIVVNRDPFSHLLAFSYSLGIPSIQVDSLPELPETFGLDTYRKVGRILIK